MKRYSKINKESKPWKKIVIPLNKDTKQKCSNITKPAPQEFIHKIINQTWLYWICTSITLWMTPEPSYPTSHPRYKNGCRCTSLGHCRHSRLMPGTHLKIWWLKQGKGILKLISKFIRMCCNRLLIRLIYSITITIQILINKKPNGLKKMIKKLKPNLYKH